FQDLRNMRPIVTSQLHGRRISFYVVLATRQSNSVRADDGHFRRCLMEARLRAKSEEHMEAGAARTPPWRRFTNDVVQVRHDFRQRIPVRQSVDTREFLLDGIESSGINCCLVHAGGVIVKRLAKTALPAGCFQDATKNGVVAFLNLSEASIPLPVLGKRMARDPTTAGKLIEVGAGVDREVERGKIDACSTALR